MEDEPHLVGDWRPARGAVAFQLCLVELDEVLGLAAGAIERVVDMFGAAGLDEVTTKRISSPAIVAGAGFDPRDDPALAVPQDCAA